MQIQTFSPVFFLLVVYRLFISAAGLPSVISRVSRSDSRRCARRSSACLGLKVLITFLVADTCSSSQAWKFFYPLVSPLQWAVNREELMNWSEPIVCHVLLDTRFWAFVWRCASLHMTSGSTWESIDFNTVKRGPFYWDNYKRKGENKIKKKNSQDAP